MRWSKGTIYRNQGAKIRLLFFFEMDTPQNYLLPVKRRWGSTKFHALVTTAK